jgi:hypothetical protein
VFGAVAGFAGVLAGSDPGELRFGFEQLIHARIPWLLLASLVGGAALGVVSLIRVRRWYTWAVVPVEVFFAALLTGYFILWDTEDVLLDDLDIRHRDSPGLRDIAFPTALLVDSNGIVRWAYETDTYRTRARPEDVLRAIGGLASGPA